MSNAKHTPGPWYYGRTNNSERIILGGPSRKYVANVTIHQLPRQAGLDDELEREANARLIMATPDLLEALADIREVLGVGHKPMLSELVEIIRELVRDKARLDWLDRSAYSLISVADSEDSYHWQIREGDVLDSTIVAISGSEDPRRCIDLAMEEEVSS